MKSTYSYAGNTVIMITDLRFIKPEMVKDDRVFLVYRDPTEIRAATEKLSFAEPTTANRRRKKWRCGWRKRGDRKVWQNRMAPYRRTSKRTVAVKWRLT